MSDVESLRPQCADELSPYVAAAFMALQAHAVGLFHARKLGIVVHIPEDVRQGMMARYGDYARKVLALLDGRVSMEVVPVSVVELRPDVKPDI